VEVFDVRSEVKEQVISLGGKFIEVEGAREDAAAGGYAVEQTEEFKEKPQQLIFDHVSRSDVVVIIGANDVVNPVARTDPKSPIAGMPIIDVDKARTVAVIKRSLSPGFAGIPNPLFAAENTLMLFGDGQKMILEISRAIKEQ